MSCRRRSATSGDWPEEVGRFSAHAILGAYERLIRLAFPKALLAAFSSYPRYSGPREAVFSALCRKNFGCTHFVLGRDHASANGVYRPRSNRELLNRWAHRHHASVL